MADIETRRIELARLNTIWEELEVDRLFSALKNRFEEPEAVTFYRPSMREILIARPFILTTYYRAKEVPTHLSKSHRPFFDETETVYRREYALALNTTGFYARYRDNSALFIEHPSQLRRPANLQSMLEANIKSERGRKPDWFTFLNNIPVPLSK